jgi:outer membrane protein assembly factor BamB
LTNQRAEGPRLIAVDASGRVKPGWPISLDDQDWSGQQLGSDGSLFLVRRPTGTPTYDPSRGVIDDDAELWAFGPDGNPRSGWPVPVPNIGGYLIGPQGSVVVRSLINDVGELCSNPRRTVFTVLDRDGRTVPGWPRGSTGYASSPVVGADGTVYYVSATYKVYAHDRAGEVKAGWPVAVPGTGNGCGPESPHLAPDGTIYLVGDQVLALSPDGGSRPGWPYRPAGQLIGPCFDTECYGGHGAPTFAPDGTVHLVVYHTDAAGIRAEVVALDRQGQPKPGWPYRLPFDANTVDIGALTVSLEGRLFVGGGSSPDVLLAVDPDGTLSD